MFATYPGNPNRNEDYAIVCGPIVIVEDSYVGINGMYYLIRVSINDESPNLCVEGSEYYSNVDASMNIEYARTTAKEVIYLQEGFLVDLLNDLASLPHLQS